MGRLIYAINTSVDGYIEDAAGAFDWVEPEQIHPFFVDLLQPVGTYLYGRRMYETMAYWEEPVEGYPPEYQDFARIWQRAEKIVFSRSLKETTTRRTRLERDFDPEFIRKLKRESERDITIGGAEIAAAALEADLVDEYHVVVHPVIVGSGKPAYQAASSRNFELFETRRVGTNVVSLCYRLSNRT